MCGLADLGLHLHKGEEHRGVIIDGPAYWEHRTSTVLDRQLLGPCHHKSCNCKAEICKQRFAAKCQRAFQCTNPDCPGKKELKRASGRVHGKANKERLEQEKLLQDRDQVINELLEVKARLEQETGAERRARDQTARSLTMARQERDDAQRAFNQVRRDLAKLAGDLAKSQHEAKYLRGLLEGYEPRARQAWTRARH